MLVEVGSFFSFSKYNSIREDEKGKMGNLVCSFATILYYMEVPYLGLVVRSTTLQFTVRTRWCFASYQFYVDYRFTNLVQIELISEYVLTIFDDFKVVCALIEYS